MKMYVVTEQTGRIIASSTEAGLVGAECIEVPDTYEMVNQADYRVEHGVLVHDPQPIDTAHPTTADRLAAVESALLELALGGGLGG